MLRAFKRKMLRKLDLMLNPSAVAAYRAWPVFGSGTFMMVSGLAKQGLRPMTVIDVGANIGQFAVAATKLFRPSDTYCFEPVPECFAQLTKNLDSLKIKVFQMALGESSGETTFHVTRGKFASSCLPPTADFQAEWPDAREEAMIPVKVSTLDREFGSIDFQRPALLKLDVQGYEAQVLAGAADVLKRIDWLIVEMGFVTRYKGEMLFSDLLRMVEERGFRFVRPLAYHVHPETGEITEMDGFFERADGTGKLTPAG